jgi:hypothetical protein
LVCAKIFVSSALSALEIWGKDLSSLFRRG